MIFVGCVCGYLLLFGVVFDYVLLMLIGGVLHCFDGFGKF